MQQIHLSVNVRTPTEENPYVECSSDRVSVYANLRGTFEEVDNHVLARVNDGLQELDAVRSDIRSYLDIDDFDRDVFDVDIDTIIRIALTMKAILHRMKLEED